MPRNLTDDQMRALAAKGGVAHTTLYHGFLRKEGEADIMDAIAHLEHAIDVSMNGQGWTALPPPGRRNWR